MTSRSPTVGGAGPSGYNIAFTKADPVQPYQSTIQGTLDVSEASSRLKEQLSSIASFMGNLAQSLRADSGRANILELSRHTLPDQASVTEDGSTTVIAIPINGGSLELRVPPKEGIAEKLGSLFGITDQAQPATCSIKNEQGEVVFQVALQEPTAITKFGQYKDVRFDENLTTWVGRSAATETWMAHAFDKYPELLTDTSVWPIETLPTEEIQRLSKALAVVSSGLSRIIRNLLSCQAWPSQDRVAAQLHALTIKRESLGSSQKWSLTCSLNVMGRVNLPYDTLSLVSIDVPIR